jgi:pimeloyl-ACP methyl ester carboxylesterase
MLAWHKGDDAMPSIDINGTQFNYSERGAGTPLVLVHGFPLDSRIWDDQVAALSDRYRVIAPDLRGFGQSRSDQPFTMESLADDLHHLLTKIGALPCVLAGLSMGGYVAFAYDSKYPTDLKGLVLIDTRCEADAAEGKQKRDKMIETVREFGSEAIANEMMPKMLAPDAEQCRPQLMQKLRAIMESCPPKTIESALAAMRDRRDYRDRLASIAVPTLIVVGDQDAITPPPMSEFMHREIPKSKLVVIKGSGHMSPMEQPEQVNHALRQSIEGVVGK